MHFFFQVFISIVVVLDFLSHALVNRIFSGLSDKPKQPEKSRKNTHLMRYVPLGSGDNLFSASCLDMSPANQLQYFIYQEN